jgi:hypothetical protein
MKQFLLIVCVILATQSYAQDINTYEKHPVFPNCTSVTVDSLKHCFNKELSQFIYTNFKVPQKVQDQGYKGDASIFFEVDKEGVFKVLYVDAIYNELKEESKRVFKLLPKVEPATYNGRATFKQYTYRLNIPVQDPSLLVLKNNNEEDAATEEMLKAKREFDSVSNSIVPYQDLEYTSQLNIPFTHQFYAQFDPAINSVGTNSHTAGKPYIYQEVAKYYDLKKSKDDLKKPASTWWGEKLWNEHMVQLQSKNYWFTLDPVADLQIGKDTDADFNSTFNNTRGVFIQGGLGNKLSFSTSIFESQGRFAQYYNQYAESIASKPGSGTETAIIPGRGIAKRFKDDAYDYPIAEAYLSYTPSSFFNVQFGHGKNFIGDGYRSLFQSDVASPHTFLKINTNFWKIKYTNTFMWLRDVRPEVEKDGAFLTKYVANHYLSWNVSKRLNLGLFESVMWVDSNGRGLDVNYLNPIIFYRAIEFESGQDSGNAIVGLSGKYKWNDQVNIYSQFVLDEFSLNDVKAGNKSWKNKFGYQIGAKYYNAFKVKNLMLQLEYNRVRPFTYSHNSIVLNYAHSNQSMAHLWGANFSEAIVLGHYRYKRWYGDAKFIFGKRGFDFNTEEDSFNYGGDIYRTEVDRNASSGIKVAQGNTTKVFHAELQGGYLVNPATNLKLFAYVAFRDFNPQADTAATFKNSTVWFNLGLRTDLFNWYFDN